MRYLIDSDWTADYPKGRETAVTLLDHLFLDGLAISQGQLIPQPDLFIGETALSSSLTLVIRNTQHFQRIPELTIYQAS